MKLCDTCEEDKFMISKNRHLDLIGLCPFPKPSEISVGIYPSNSDIEITIKETEIEPGKKIYYWGASTNSLIKSSNISNAKEAYKGKNFGCTKVRKDNKIIFKIASSRCYFEDKTLWSKHFHFISKEKESDNWDFKNMYTCISIPVKYSNIETKKLACCNVYVTPMQVKINWKKGKFFMVFALGEEYKSLHDLEEFNNYNHIRLPWNSKKNEIPSKIKKDTPLVIYCAKKTCDAGKRLISKLIKKGYENLFYMEEGMMGFSKDSKKLFTS